MEMNHINITYSWNLWRNMNRGYSINILREMHRPGVIFHEIHQCWWLLSRPPMVAILYGRHVGKLHYLVKKM